MVNVVPEAMEISPVLVKVGVVPNWIMFRLALTLIVPEFVWAAEFFERAMPWFTFKMPWLSSSANISRVPPEPTLLFIMPLLLFVSVPLVTARIWE